MQTITFDTEFANRLELAICLEFECRVSEIVSIRDTFVKKVVVYILSTSKNYNARIIAAHYQISYLFVPTVVVEMDHMIKRLPAVGEKINSVLERVKN